MPKITLIVPTVGINYKYFESCINSIISKTKLNDDVKLLIMVNGCKDENVFKYLEDLKKYNLNIEVITSESALGFIGATNYALEYESKNNPDFYVLVNDDVSFHAINWLDDLLSPFSDEKMGIVGALSLKCPITGVSFPLGFCLMIRKSLMDEIGNLDKSLGIGYGDDTVLTIEAIKRGYKTFAYCVDDGKGNRTGGFPISHNPETTMHSNVLFSIDDWHKQTEKNRNILAERYWPIINVVVPTFGRFVKLQKALENIDNQTFKKLKVHVCSDGNDEKVKSIVEKFNKKYETFEGMHPEYFYSYCEHEGLVGGLPRKTILDFLPNNENEFVCFIDSDNEVNNNFIHELWKPLFLTDSHMSFCKIFHQETDTNIPIKPDTFPTFTDIDSLNVLIPLNIAKKYSNVWLQNRDEPINHDFNFISACSKELTPIFVNECLGRHGQSELSIGVFTPFHSEWELLPHYLKYYSSIADKIYILYGGDPNDKNIEILKNHNKVELIIQPNDKLDDMELMFFRNEYYKQFKYDHDYVIISDVDEIIYYLNLRQKLQESKKNNITIFRVEGYQMVSDMKLSNIDHDKNYIFDIIKSGYRDKEHLDKLCLFDPRININYTPGCHSANPEGNLVYDNISLKLLHFKYVDYDLFISKAKKSAARISDENKRNNWGFHYAIEQNTTKEEFINLINKCDNVVDFDDKINPLLNRTDLKQQHDTVFNEIITNNQYRVTKKDLQYKNIIDLGANTGIFSLLSDTWGSKKIIAVEANPGAFKLLEINSKNTKIIPINKAIYSVSGNKIRIDNDPNFCLHDGRHHIIPDNNGNIETINLNDIIDQIDDGTDILLKSDCEGSEYSAIYSADINKLRKCKTILIEMHEDIINLTGKKGLINKLSNYLKSIGYVEKWKNNHVEDKVVLFRFDLEKELDNDITVIINAFLKPELLERQIESFKNQTLKPKQIIVYQTKPTKDFKVKEIDGVDVIYSNTDFGINSRFAIVQLATTSYIYSVDDDIFPGNKWLEESYKLSKINNCIVSPYGVDYENGNYNDLNSKRYGDDGERNKIPQKVDLGGHGFFGRKDWFKVFFKEEPLDNKIADDVHFSVMLQKYLNLDIYVSPYPENNKDIWGNLDVSAGKGFRSLHTRNGDFSNEELITKIGWRNEDIEYLKNNLNNFCEKRAEIVKKYAEKINDVTNERKIEKKKNNTEVTVVIPTKNRYFSTLPLTLISIINQTHKPKKIILIDDSDDRKDLRNEPLYQYIFQLIFLKKIEWEVIFGQQKGQHISHQMGLDRSNTEWILRTDDDEILEYNVLEILVDSIEDSVGCIAGLVLDPTMAKPVPENYINNNKIEDINTRENTQWMIHSPGNIIEADHLYSSFLYKKVSDISFCNELSPASHREESLFTLEYKRRGYRNIVNTSAITWHFRNSEGGIRSHQQHPEYWQRDDEIFKRKLRSWGMKGFEGKKMIVLDLGIGDCIVFLKIIPELIKKYPKLVIGTYYPFLFKEFPQLELLHTWAAKDIKGEKMAELDNVYKYLWDETLGKGRKIDLLTGLRELFLGDNK